MALFIKGKIIFAFALVVWALIGPVNFVFLGIHLQEIARWLNLGEPNPEGLYNHLYGVSIDWFHWLKHFVWIVVLSILLLLYLYNKYFLIKRKTLWISMAVLMLLFTSISYGLNLNWQLYINGQSENSSRESVESFYYSKKQPIFHQENIEASSYKIDLKINRLMAATVDMVVENGGQKDINHFSLSLYHGLKVKKVKADHNSVRFKQENDLVTIYLNKRWDSGKSINLTFEYEGNSSPLFYANQRAVYLPYYFNWLPSVDVDPSFSIDQYRNLIRNNHQMNHLTDYVLEYDGRTPLYTNLTKKENGKWEGTSSTGLTLLSGELQSRQLGDATLIYPGDTKGLNYNKFKSSTQDVLKSVAKDLNINGLDYPKTIIMTPILSTADNSMEEMIWYSKETLILGYPSNSWYLDMPAYYTYWLVPAVTWKYEDIKVDDRDYLHAFNLMYSYLYNEKNHIKDDGDFLDQYKDVQDSSEKQKFHQQLHDWLVNDTDIAKKNQFCKEWYQLMKTSQVSWEELNSLLNKYDTGGKS